MYNKSNIFWTIYKKIESEVIDLSYFIHFSDEKRKDNGNQIWTYSNKIADLLIAISTQIEAISLELFKSEYAIKPETVGKGLSMLDEIWKLSDKQVMIISKNMFFEDVNKFGSVFAPMSYNKDDENDYYSAYCAVKHNRIDALYKANINVLIRALAALFILNVYYIFEDIDIDEISGFDFTLGSEVFMLKYSVNSSSSNDILIVKEDLDYLKKIMEYANLIPSIDSGEFLQFKDETVEPKRYNIKINKQR